MITLESNCLEQRGTSLSVKVLQSCDLVDPLPLFFELSPPLSIWFRMAHVLQFDEQTRKVKDANMQDEDTFEIYDPRNPVNKRRREESKKIMKEKKAKRWGHEVEGQVLPKPCDWKTGHTASRLPTFPPLQTPLCWTVSWLEHLDLRMLTWAHTIPVICDGKASSLGTAAARLHSVTHQD